MASHTWRELSGENNWVGLLDPLDNDLRMYIIRYGERAQAILDAFNNEDVSPACNFSRFPMEGFFSYVGLEINNPYKYEVKRFIYTKNFPFLGETTWIGYVAVATDEGVMALGRRDILVSWRCTIRSVENVVDISDQQVVATDLFPGDSETMIHKGWYNLYNHVNLLHDDYTKTSARAQVLEEIESLIQTYSNDEISITVVGHSLGGALATINGADIVINGKNNIPGKNPCPVTVFTFSSPMVGNESFQKKVDGLDNLNILRTENVLDIVPHLPPVNYYPVGQTLQVDSRDSPYLKYFQDMASMVDVLGEVHLLEPLLHLVAGTKGVGKGFDLDNRRQVALVNKDGDYLKADVAKENQAPASWWWVVKNKGMVQKANDGSWVLDDYKPDP